MSSCSEAVRRQEVRDVVVDVFLKVWYSDYLRNVPPGLKSGVKGEVKVGSVVMVRENGCPRLQWPMAVIEQLYPGKDGVVRTVLVKTSRRSFVKPIQCIHDLELLDTSTIGDPNEYHENQMALAYDDIGARQVEPPDLETESVAEAREAMSSPPNLGDETDSEAMVKISHFRRKIKPVVQFDLWGIPVDGSVLLYMSFRWTNY